jgi:aminopeptidase N
MSVLQSRSHLVFAMAVFCGAGCDEPNPPSTELGVAWDLAEHRERTIRELSYQIDLGIPEDRTEPIVGTTILRFEWDDPEAFDLVVDFMNPGERVHNVRVNWTEAAWLPIHDHVVIPAEALEPGRNEVWIDYLAGDEALNRNDEFLYTLFVPDRAHFSLPVFDQPNLKASVAWTLRVPEGWKAVANGPLDEASVGQGGHTLSFSPTRPIPTYLFAFAAGDFEEDHEVVGDRTLRMYHRETDTDKVARNRDAIFQLHARAVEWLEEYTGIKYPFQKFDFVLIPSFQYGGMEHPGGILYRQGGLMLDETATQGQILGRASLIAHETAHMWFGDLVTMNWFDDVWTKEVFANFMAAKIVHPSFPEIDHELRFLLAHHPSAYGVDRTQGANPIRQPLENLREAGSLYGAIIYQKAPIVMRHLEARVGEETFRDGLREYLETFSYGNATWPDLIEILDRRSPEDLASWSRVWIEEPGRPTIAVTVDGADVVVEQSDPAGLGRVWPQTLQVRVARDEGDTLVALELGSEPAVVAGVGGDDVRYVLPNGSGLEYGLFSLDEGSLAYLVEHAGSLADGRVRGTAWVTLWDQVLEGRLDPGTFLDIALAALSAEDDELNLGRILSYVSTAYWRLLAPAERARRAPAVEAAIWDGVESDRPATARSLFLGSFRGVALTPDGVERLRRLWAGEEAVEGLPLSESDQTALAAALAVREVDGWAEVLDEQAARIANPDRAARFAFVRPSLDADPSVREAFFRSLADPSNREREPWVLEGLGHLHHPLRAEGSLGMVRPALDMVEEIQRTGDIFFPGRWLGATLGGHSEVETAEAVRRFLDETPELPSRLRGKVLQSADMVWRAAAIVHGWSQP